MLSGQIIELPIFLLGQTSRLYVKLDNGRDVKDKRNTRDCCAGLVVSFRSGCSGRQPAVVAGEWAPPCRRFILDCKVLLFGSGPCSGAFCYRAEDIPVGYRSPSHLYTALDLNDGWAG